MSEINERSFERRSSYIFALIIVIVLSIMLTVVSLIIIHPPKSVKDSYTGKNNILFIVIDDLRPILRCYGDPVAVTPNIDTLASNSIIFKNAYAQQALGGPSRISFLTSRRPDSLHLYDSGSYWRETVGNFFTIPEHFKNHGFETLSIGKVFPHGVISNFTDDYPSSWELPPYWPPSQEYETKPICGSNSELKRNLICPVDVETQPGNTLPDIESTEHAIEFLKNKSQKIDSSAPFFLAVGYHKPHIPFRIPKNYYDLYPDIDLAASHTQIHFPKVSYNPWMDIREMEDVKNLNLSSMFDRIPKEFQKLIRKAYYASVSYIDDQVGRLLEALEDTGFAQHTTIVLLGDHGWSLGEHQEWSKYSNFEVALQVPLIIHVPELTTGKERKPFKRTSVLDLLPDEEQLVFNDLNNKYKKKHPAYTSNDLVELVDIFPTLSELSNIAIPPICNLNMSDFCSEGNSIFPIIEHMVHDPEPWIPFSWKTAAFSQYPRPSLAPQNDSDMPLLDDIEIMGYSIRTESYRYTEWVSFDNEDFKPDWALIISRELYCHINDPDETENLCDQDAFANTVIKLSQRLKRGWHAEMPPGFDNF